MVSIDHMLISILSVSVQALDMSCAVVAEACDLKADYLLSLLHLMCDLKNPSLSCIQV